MDASRRAFLAGVGLAGVSSLAGCGDRSPRRTSIGIIVTNETTTEQRVTLRLYRLPEERASDEREETPATPATPATADLEEVFVQRATLAAGDDVAVPGDDLPPGDFRVGLVTADGPTGEYDWDRLDERSTLDVRIRSRSVQFTELD